MNSLGKDPKQVALGKAWCGDTQDAAGSCAVDQPQDHRADGCVLRGRCTKLIGLGLQDSSAPLLHLEAQRSHLPPGVRQASVA